MRESLCSSQVPIYVHRIVALVKLAKFNLEMVVRSTFVCFIHGFISPNYLQECSYSSSWQFYTGNT